jgi:uncharacterized membrane protein YtjA (UPF0391 family)
MLVYSVSFLAVAILAVLLGFRSIAWGSAGIACVSLVVFVVASIAMLLWQLSTSHRSASPL